jgi:hypothetical protein
MVDDRLLVWKGQLMNQSGSLTLIKTTLSAVPIYTSIGESLSPWMLRVVEKIMKAFLWTEIDVV